MVNNAFRLDYLVGYWKEEMKWYKIDLEITKNKKMKAILKMWDDYDEDLALALLRLYLDRCR